MNPNSAEERGRLFDAIDWSHKQLRPFRASREKMVKEYVGHNYSEEVEEQKEILVNLMFQAADVYTMLLAANLPRVLVSTQHKSLKWFGKKFQVAVNNLIKEIHLQQTLQACTLDAFFSIGIAKVYLADSGMVELEHDLWVDPGQPFVARISLDDWTHDMSATDWHHIRFAADYYRVPLAKVLEDKELYDPKVARNLTSSDVRDEEYRQGDQRVSDLSQGQENRNKDVEPMVDLMDVWLPYDRLVVTWPRQKAHTPPLHVQEWDGPEGGPYHRLYFSETPDNTMPVAPASNLHGLSDLVNRIVRKQAKQAKRQKDITIYEARAMDDARRLQRAADGELTRVDHVDAIQVLKQGGVDPGNGAFMLQMVDIFDRLAGNLPALAGLGPQAETLGQENIIRGAANSRVAKMMQKTQEFSAGIITDLGHLMWIDQAMEIPGTVNIPDTSFEVDATWTAEDREGDILQYNFDIEPYSMTYKSPSERAQAITSTLQQLVIPLAPQIEAAGGQIDYQAMLEILAELYDQPRLMDIVKFQGPPAQPDMGPQGTPKQSPVTTRNYVRRNVPTGGTEQSRHNTMAQALLGQKSNPDQMAALTR